MDIALETMLCLILNSVII